MPDWLTTFLARMQSGLIDGLVAELGAGGIGTAVFAMILGALHALTPGHGKAAVIAYFLGREASVGRGARLALTGSALHVLNGLVLFLVSKLVIGAAASITGRPPPSVAGVGYVLIIGAGLLMLWQSLRSSRSAEHDGGVLAVGIGLLPCPLTISVLGFAWTQASLAMIALIVAALFAGIALTITGVAVGAILIRRTVGQTLGPRLASLESAARVAQGMAGASIAVIGIYTLTHLGA